MAEDIKSFIEKIQQEGVRLAQDKARQIQEDALRQAEKIAQDAKIKTEQITQEAKEKLVKMDVDQRTLLEQAGRDFLLFLRSEINNILYKLTLAKAREALTPGALSEILTYIIKETVKADSPSGEAAGNKAEIIVMLKPDDLNKIKESLQVALADQIKKGIVFKSQEDIEAGFLISYDAGKSQFDFSDKSLAEFISSSIKPQLEDLLKNITKE